MLFRSVAESPYQPSRRVNAFRKRLEAQGITATVRRKLGSDIDASCGQLRRKQMLADGKTTKSPAEKRDLP